MGVTTDIDWTPIDRVFESARGRGARVLLETEGNELLGALGFALPQSVFVRNSTEWPPRLDASGLAGSERVVVKVVSPEILHKSDGGGVKVVANDNRTIAGAIHEMERQFAPQQVAGYTVNEFVAYDRSLGHELLLGLRWTEDFGSVVTFSRGASTRSSSPRISRSDEASRFSLRRSKTRRASSRPLSVWR